MRKFENTTSLKGKSWVLLMVIFMLMYNHDCQSQVQQEWVARYNGPNNNQDYAYAMAVDTAGNVYVTGSSKGTAEATEDYCTIKYSPEGVEMWVQRYNGTGNGRDNAYAIELDRQGNVYVTGSSVTATHYEDIVTIKYSPSGSIAWIRNYTGPTNSYNGGRSVTVDGNNNIVVTGHSWSNGAMDFCTLKYDNNGNQLWVETYDGPLQSHDIAWKVVTDAASNVYITGSSYSTGNYSSDYCTIKYNSSGVQQWVARYNNDGDDDPFSLAVDLIGNVYVTGWSSNSGNFTADFTTIKYLPTGVQQWVRRYNPYGILNNFGQEIVTDSTNLIYATGRTSDVTGYYQISTLKYNTEGGTLWAKDYPSNYHSVGYGIALDRNRNVYVGGSFGNPSYGTDMAVIKYSNDGVMRWIQTYHGTGSIQSLDEAHDIVVDRSGNIYITGWSEGNGSRFDYTTIKYSQPIGIEPVSNEIPSGFKLHQNYPNPFNSAAEIEFEISSAALVELTVSDLLGKEVTKLVKQDLEPGIYSTVWNAAGFPSGVYFYSLLINNIKIDTKKMILTK